MLYYVCLTALVFGLNGFLPTGPDTWVMPLWMAITLTVGGFIGCAASLLADKRRLALLKRLKD
jgi:hypothetical protein